MPTSPLQKIDSPTQDRAFFSKFLVLHLLYLVQSYIELILISYETNHYRLGDNTAQKMKFSIKDFSSKFD